MISKEMASNINNYKEEKESIERKIDAAIKKYNGNPIRVDCNDVNSFVKKYIIQKYTEGGWKIIYVYGQFNEMANWFLLE